MGSTNKMIAKTLGISEGTVKIHLASIFQQLGATNRAAAVPIYNGVQSSHLEILRSTSNESEMSGDSPSVESPAVTVPENTETTPSAESIASAESAEITESSGEPTCESAEHAPIETEASNVIPLHRDGVKYPSLTDNEGIPRCL